MKQADRLSKDGRSASTSDHQLPKLPVIFSQNLFSPGNISALMRIAVNRPLLTIFNIMSLSMYGPFNSCCKKNGVGTRHWETECSAKALTCEDIGLKHLGLVFEILRPTVLQFHASTHLLDIECMVVQEPFE